MAVASYPANHPLAVKLWSKALNQEALKKTYVWKFLGKDTNSLLQIKDDTSKTKGDRITIGLRMLLSGGGVIGDGTLEGQEEGLTTYSDNILLNQLRHAVRSAGKMSEQRIPFEIREEARAGLADWWADRYDFCFFNQICGNTAVSDIRYTGNNAIVPYDEPHIYRPNNRATDEALVAGDEMNLQLIEALVERAKIMTPMIRPVKVNGDDFWVLFVHPSQAYNLRTQAATESGSWYDIQRFAMAGGDVKNNPIFTGALGIYNGVILHDSARIPLGVHSETGCPVPDTRRAVFCGAQTAAIAFGRDTTSKDRFSWVEELFDYGNQLGVSAGAIFGLKRFVYNDASFSSIVVPTYAVKH
jgi:N4-gp56 family major capsid protein